MAPPVRRPATPTPTKAPGINFGDLDAYAGGFTLPEGDYAMEHNVMMFTGTKADGTPVGPERLGVMVTAHPLGGGEAQQQFFSMGSNAHKSFQPDAETGKRVISVPGGAGASPNNKTNWFLYLKSLYDCGLPKGIFTDDVSVIDGVWVHTSNIPEPEERKGFGQAKTGEAEQPERLNKLIPVVSEIKDDGKPWEGTGGFDFAPTPAAAPVVKPGPKGVVAGKKAAPAPVVQEAATDTEDVEAAAQNGISSVLEKNPNGLLKLPLRTSTFKAVSASSGEEMANAVLEAYFSSDEALNGILGQLGYKVVGTSVKPA